MKYIYNTSQISKLSLTLHTFGITSSVASLFLTIYGYYNYYKLVIYITITISHDMEKDIE